MDLWSSLNVNLSPDIQNRLLASLIIIIVLWILRMIVVYVINARVEGIRRRYTWHKTISYVTAVLGVLLVGRLWLSDIQALATFLGLVSAGLAIALQGPVTDLAGWVFIIWRRPFEIGDRIELGQHAGDVVDVRIFQFTMLEIGNWVEADQSTGRILNVPNRMVFSDILANYTKGFEYIWNEIPVRITFESNWQKAKTILEEIANQDAAHLSGDAAERIRMASKRYMIMYSKLTPIVYMRVEQSGVVLTIRYLCAPRRRRSTEQSLWEDILSAFAGHPDIELAYPTQRFYQRHLESQPFSTKNERPITTEIKE